MNERENIFGSEYRGAKLTKKLRLFVRKHNILLYIEYYTRCCVSADGEMTGHDGAARIIYIGPTRPFRCQQMLHGSVNAET